MENIQGKIILDNTEYKTNLTKNYLNGKQYKKINSQEIRAFIPGTIRSIFVKEKDSVKKGDELLILEAMKMKNRIFAPVDGKIKKVYVNIEERVAKNQILIELE